MRDGEGCRSLVKESLIGIIRSTLLGNRGKNVERLCSEAKEMRVYCICRVKKGQSGSFCCDGGKGKFLNLFSVCVMQ